MSVSEQGIDRRAFMKTTAAAAAATALAAPAAHGADDALIHRNQRGGMTYRKLGRTNFMCSRLVFGGGAALMGGKAVRLLDIAFDKGVNFYDLGFNTYYRGAEKSFAPFMKANRDEIWVTSKAMVRPAPDHTPLEPLTTEQGKIVADAWLEQLDNSLRELDTDYVDAYYLMAVGDPAYVRCEQLHEAFLKAKQAGKVGHFGVSTHKRAEHVLDAMVETGWYDLAMIAVTPAGWYDWDSKSLLEGTPSLAALQPVLQRARDAGIGLVGMKAARYIAGKGAGGAAPDTAFDEHYSEEQLNSGLTPWQRSYAYVLANGVDVVNSDMQNIAHFEANLAAVQRSDEVFLMA